MKRYLNKTLQSFSKTNLEITVVILFVVIFSEHVHIVLLIYHVCPFLLSLLFSACQWTLFQIGLCKNESGCSSFFVHYDIQTQANNWNWVKENLLSCLFSSRIAFQRLRKHHNAKCKHLWYWYFNRDYIYTEQTLTRQTNREKKTSTTGEMGNEAHFIF